MSKPPSKSGGSFGRGRNSGSGSSRDGSSFGGGPRGGSSRGGSSSGDGPRYNAGSGSARGRSGRDDGPAEGAQGSRGGRGRREAPRIGSREDFRSEFPRRNARDGGPRDGAERPRSDRPRSDRPRGDAPRSDRPREDGQRSGAYRSGSARDGGPRAERPSDARRDARRDGGRDGERGYRPRSDERGPGDRFGSDRGPRPAYGNAGRPQASRPNMKPGAAPRAAAPTPKDPTLPAREGERIAKLLARAGVASRREVERLIIEGRVALNDVLIETPSTVLTSLRGVTVDGNPIAEAEGTRLFLFHKPSGLITAERDPAGRPTIYTALRNALPEGTGRVMPIGRLDLNTEGLLLLTNDGEFKRQLELPATGVPRTYRARTFGDITQGQLEELMEGIEVDGVIYGKIDANMERRTGRNQWIELTLTEGKNREVRRVLEALGLQVSRLLRTAYGPFRLGDLPKGMAGEVSQRDLENFRKSLPGQNPTRTQA
ncbi:pseudouridine synthase [Novosphingobium guangzhouense]|uniref:Pseudouridine synthase n=1 Tax=Novosphingobium guangzhouense TaxID=1850347 RepID=A0A2K2G0W1_9SPHN|nr:pseudouridine synthase [Novosphingobium guangzhouense]PNU04634.1 pseudouridine synthase [Novosphingobium guangzhouense]